MLSSPFLFYPSRVYSGTKDYRYQPENITKRVMLNPVYKVTTLNYPFDALVDSGAFQDIDKHERLTPAQAFDRQRRYRDKLRKDFRDFDFEAVSIYDQMIGVDECVIDGKKIKRRGTKETAKQAVEATLYSARYYNDHRDEYNRIIYIAQGIDPEQYLECTEQLLTYIRPGLDYFGFGGFCIIGRQRKIMLPIFQETCISVFPALARAGIHRAHLFGICLPEAVKIAKKYGDMYGIQLSTDSSAPEINAVAFGKMYTEEGRINRSAGIKWIDYNPIELAHSNVRKYNEWIKNLVV